MSGPVRGALLLFLALGWAALDVAGQAETFRGYATAYTCKPMCAMGRLPLQPPVPRNPAPPADANDARQD